MSMPGDDLKPVFLLTENQAVVKSLLNISVSLLR